MIDILLLLVFGIVTWCVASEGAWGAALMALTVIFSGLLAMNFFEPMAGYLQATAFSSPRMSGWCDVLSLVGLFSLFVFGIRMASEYLIPEFVPVRPMVHDAARWVAAALAGYTTMAFLLTALHTTPLPREFIGFKPERSNLLEMAAPDRQWLGFVQYVSEKSFRRGSKGRVFDGPTATIGTFSGRWPSFPIRYATWREKGAMSGGSKGTKAPVARPVTPQPTKLPGSNSGKTSF